jgi:hypothetical protein
MHFTSQVKNKLILFGPDALTLLDTVWDDVRIVPGTFQFVGASDPTIANWQPGGSGTIFKVYKFQKTNEAFFTCQIPHTYKQGTDIEAHLHWTPCDRGVAEGVAKVGWKIDYSWVNISGAFVASATLDLSDACSGVDDAHELTACIPITGTSKNISSMLVCRVYRSDTGTDDTWVGTTVAQSPALLEVDFHFEINTMGSREELTK